MGTAFFKLLDGDMMRVDGSREPAHERARFTISDSGGVLADNVDWPTAWNIITPPVTRNGGDMGDVDSLLRRALEDGQ